MRENEIKTITNIAAIIQNDTEIELAFPRIESPTPRLGSQKYIFAPADLDDKNEKTIRFISLISLGRSVKVFSDSSNIS